MTATIKRSQRKYAPEQEKRLREIAVAFSKHMQPVHDSMRQASEIFIAQDKALKGSLESITQSVKIPTFDLPIIDTKALSATSIPCVEAIKQAQELTKSLTPSIQSVELIKQSFKVDLKNLKSFELTVPPNLTKVASAMAGIEPLSSSSFYHSEVRRVQTLKPKEDRPRLNSVDRNRIDERFDRLEMNFEILSAQIVSTPLELEEVSDFKFKIEGLYISYKEERMAKLSGSEMILCQQLFSKPIGYNFPTTELENIFYPEPQTTKSYKQENFKKIVDRFNKKIRNNTNIEQLVAYSTNYVTRTI